MKHNIEYDTSTGEYSYLGYLIKVENKITYDIDGECIDTDHIVWLNGNCVTTLLSMSDALIYIWNDHAKRNAERNSFSNFLQYFDIEFEALPNQVEFYINTNDVTSEVEFKIFNSLIYRGQMKGLSNRHHNHPDIGDYTSFTQLIKLLKMKFYQYGHSIMVFNGDL